MADTGIPEQTTEKTAADNPGDSLVEITAKDLFGDNTQVIKKETEVTGEVRNEITSDVMTGIDHEGRKINTIEENAKKGIIMIDICI